MAYTDIDKPTDYFNTSTWTATTSAISNLDFSPDWVWIKSTDSANGQILFDTIRGANKRLSSASDGAESTRTDELMSFDSNGYTLGSSGNTNDTSPFNASYVGWSWRGSDSSAVSNTNGSITSTVSANTTSGFSIVSYTGTGANATVGHGLGVAPAMIMIKAISYTQEWVVYNQGLGNTHAIPLHLTESKSTSSTFWQNTTPSSSVFYIGANDKHNKSGETFIAYCFAEKKGFSKMGSYVGVASSDSNFVFLGFKPSFLLIKNTSTSGTNWHMYDNKRLGYNVDNNMLRANLNNASQTDDDIDLLSNGFKLRRSTSALNNSGDTFIYYAVAESPFTTSTGIPTTAR